LKFCELNVFDPSCSKEHSELVHIHALKSDVQQVHLGEGESSQQASNAQYLASFVSHHGG